MKKAAAVLLALCLIMSAALADDEISISPDLFVDVYNIASDIYGVQPLGEMKIDYTIAYTRYWETEHEKISVMLDLDENIKIMTITADLSSRVFLNVCFCALQAMNDHSMKIEEKGQIVQNYFLTGISPDALWTLNDHVQYQFSFRETDNVMNVFVN